MYKKLKSTKLPKHLGCPEKITITKNIQKVFELFSDDDLLRINKNKKTSIELLSLMISFFNFQQYKSLATNEDDEDDFIDYNKSLNSKYFNNLFGKYKEKYLFKMMIDLLVKEKVIKMTKQYKVGENSRNYTLLKQHLELGFDDIILKSSKANHISEQIKLKALEYIIGNIIAENEVEVYKTLKKLTRQEVKSYGLELVKNKVIIKGKRFYKKKLRKHLMIFDYLTNSKLAYQGFLIPIISHYGRVYTSYNLMPTWIRNMYGKSELDYSCLHPNIVVSIYEKDGDSVSHEKIAEYLGKSRAEIKKLHLSFFNDRLPGKYDDGTRKNYGMFHDKYDGLINYYNKFHPGLISTIVEDKIKNKHTNINHNITMLETTMMKSIILELRSKGIKPLYVFDALYVDSDEVDTAREIMNRKAVEFGIKTKV